MGLPLAPSYTRNPPDGEKTPPAYTLLVVGLTRAPEPAPMGLAVFPSIMSTWPPETPPLVKMRLVLGFTSTELLEFAVMGIVFTTCANAACTISSRRSEANLVMVFRPRIVFTRLSLE
jgi:hypothetical protein